MATERQRRTARRNIKKAQATWQGMSSRARSRSQPEGRRRRKPGTTGEGNYYHVEVRSKTGFVTFRTHDIGDVGHLQRVAGKRESGAWSTVKWLIGKDDAHIERGRLVADSEAARNLFRKLGTVPVRVKGDRFKAQDRPNIPEKDKPTAAQRRARGENIKKAQAARTRDTKDGI